MFEPNTHRYTNCEYCGRRFVDDCGDSFCSSSCTNNYEEYHKQCMTCGDEREDNNWDNSDICDSCAEEEEE
jgi:hypothetical protein